MWGSRLSQQSLQGEEASSEGGLYEAPAAGVASSSIPGGFGGGTSNLSKSASSSSLLRASLSRTLSSGAGLGGLGGGAAAEERGGLSGWAGLEGRAEPLSRSASGLLAVSERERFDGRSGSVTDLSAALQRAGLGEEAPSPLARVSSRFALASAQQPLAATCEDSLPSFPGHPLAGAFGSFNCDGPQPPSVARPLPVPQQLPAHSFAQPGPLLYSPEQIAHLLQMQQLQCALPALPLPGYPPAYLPPFGQPVAPGCGFGMEGAAEASAFYAAYYAHLAAGAGAAGGVGYLGGVGMAGFPGQLYGSAAPFYPPYYAGLDLCLLQRAGGREPHGAGGYGAPPRASPPGSRLLEEFRASRSSRFELRHLAGHVLEFASDQHGSRFIQHQLESAPAGDCQLVFAELQPYAPRLMDDVFGNYVIQKFLEHGTEAQRALLLAQLTGRVLPLSLQMYGCRVVQKALEVLPPEGQARLIDELEEHLQQCVADQNGNHGALGLAQRSAGARADIPPLRLLSHPALHPVRPHAAPAHHGGPARLRAASGAARVRLPGGAARAGALQRGGA